VPECVPCSGRYVESRPAISRFEERIAAGELELQLGCSLFLKAHYTGGDPAKGMLILSVCADHNEPRSLFNDSLYRVRHQNGICPAVVGADVLQLDW
jgi:hypothetical protein